MPRITRPGRRAAIAGLSGVLALSVALGGGISATAAPEPDSTPGPGRAANAEAARKAITNGSGKQRAVKPVKGSWMDTKLTSDQRADLLLAQMTLEEKVSRLHGEYSGETAFYIAPLPRLGIPALLLTDAGAGVRVTNPNTNGGEATALPAPIALGATWDTTLATAYGDVLGTETRATGQNGLLGPTGDLVRDARWGRQFESLGEEPRLVSDLLAAQITAVQSHDVVATVKHPAAYTQETSRLNGGNVDVSERALREVYLAPIEAAIDAGVGSAMCSFNRVNDVYACESAEVFDILKKDYGFAGFIQTDYAAAHSTDLAANSGLDVEFPAGNYFGQSLIESVKAGRVSMATIDDKVHRVLRTMFEFGSFDTPVAVTALPEAADGAVARRVAEAGTVLLKNGAATGAKTPLLPLSSSIKSLAVIGADADALAVGGGSSVVKPTYSVTPLDALKARAGAGVKVTYAEGTDSVGPAHTLSGAAVPSSVLAPKGEPTATGVTAEYWFNSDRSGTPNVVRNEDQIALSGGFLALSGLYGSSVPKVPGYEFGGPLSARWTGTITAPTTGEYTLSLTGFGSARLFLDGREIIDASDAHAVRTDTGAALQLRAGEAHDLRVEYVNNAYDADQESAADLVMTWTHPANLVTPAMAQAVAAAKASDVAVVVARDYVGEGRDKSTLTLANEQDALISAVAKANPRTVVVLTTSGSVNTPWLNQVPSVVEAWYGGQEQGNAIASVLFGDVNPSGKLPVTFATADSATPTADAASFPGINRSATVSDGVNIGYRAYRAEGITPQFAFGHGLSYTTFGYSSLKTKVTGKPVKNGGTADVSVTVDLKNTGTRAGAETVQVYIGALPTPVATSPLQLAGYAKTDLAKGASTKVTIPLDSRAFSYWDSAADRWVTPTGTVPIYVGTSSSDIRQQGTVTIR
ncbi:glycoside hydrolase family 3 protein [Planctomonas deserti]|uniref:glycoside hydrolase family 3 protein n=1 Tax=Planctomonas deserti TaxID=2144185 RepID=UPI000D39BED4|nr:glycoside hydrolase family 3 C-terminal domain-containing protein [Planctomonas deserti]